MRQNCTTSKRNIGRRKRLLLDVLLAHRCSWNSLSLYSRCSGADGEGLKQCVHYQTHTTNGYLLVNRKGILQGAPTTRAGFINLRCGGSFFNFYVLVELFFFVLIQKSLYPLPSSWYTLCSRETLPHTLYSQYLLRPRSCYPALLLKVLFIGIFALQI